MQVASEGYRRKRTEEPARVVVLLPRSEAQAIDAWAIPAGQTSRSAAIRLLLKKGLEAVWTTATEPALQA